MQRIGLFGGSFNPIHKGHLIMAECFINSLQLDKCVLIPTGVSPFKHSDDYNLFTSEQRLAMVETACEDNPKLIVWDYEIKKGGTSYSIDTILYAKKIFPEAELFG